MKKKILRVLSVLFSVMFVLAILGFTYAPKYFEKKTNSTISDWIKENIEAGESVAYSLRYSVTPESGDKNLVYKTEHISPIDMRFDISVNRTQGIARLKLTYCRYYNGKEVFAEEYSDKDYYVSAQGDKLLLYLPTVEGYKSIALEGEKYVAMTRNILFFEDTDWLYSNDVLTSSRPSKADNAAKPQAKEGTVDMTYTADDEYEYSVTRKLPSEGLYTAFATPNNDIPKELPALYVAIKVVVGDVYPEEGNRLIINLYDAQTPQDGTEQLFAYIYEAVYPESYVNIYSLNNHVYRQSLTAYFPVDYRQTDVITLPN